MGKNRIYRWLKTQVERHGRLRDAYLGFGAVIWFNGDTWTAEKDGQIIGQFDTAEVAKNLMEKTVRYEPFRR